MSPTTNTHEGRLDTSPACDDRDRLEAIAFGAAEMAAGPDDGTVERLARAAAAVTDEDLRRKLASRLAVIDDALDSLIELVAPGRKVEGWGRRLAGSEV